MNAFTKAFCRTFQFFFRIAMPILPYREPIRFSRMEDLAHALPGKNLHIALLVTDSCTPSGR